MKDSIIRLLFGLPFLFFFQEANAQIIGPNPVETDVSVTYTYTDGTYYAGYRWATNGGTIEDHYRSGFVYYVTIRWTVEMQARIEFYSTQGGPIEYARVGKTAVQQNVLPTDPPPPSTETLIAWRNVDVVSCVTPATPNPVFSLARIDCAVHALSYSGSAPPGTTWYWQTTELGTSLEDSTNPIYVFSTGTYYLRAKTNTGNCWSDAVSYTAIIPVLQAPALPSISVNECGSKVLTKGTAPANINWYWQGTNNMGTDLSSSTAISPTYSVSSNGTTIIYLRAYNTLTNCWGPSRATTVTVNIPGPLPLVNPTVACESQSSVTLYPYGFSTSVNWYNTSDQLVYSGPYFTQYNLRVGTYSYKAKNVNGSCESSASTTYTITVLAGGYCDNNLNWAENTTYALDQAGQAAAIAASKAYSDGFGNVLQSQSKSYETNQVFAAQAVYDREGNASLSTLPAPIDANTFGYRSRFITNAAGNAYSATDFDLTTTTGAAGEVNNPKAVGNSGPGSLGWYYSSANTLEPNTPITSYPYARQYTAPGPNPTLSKMASSGDAFRMGAGHEVVSQRVRINSGDMPHYFQLMSHFLPGGSDEVTYSNEADSKAAFPANQNASITEVLQNGQTYVKAVSNQTASTPGIWPIGSEIPVVPSSVYKIRVKGYSTSNNVKLFAREGISGATLLWPGASLPVGQPNEAWVESIFTVPSGVTKVSLGVLFSPPAIGDAFFINAIELVRSAGASALGYKSIATDPNGKKIVSFSDPDGRVLATAVLTGTNTYENWSYVYYNSMGQVIASVAPNGVNTASSAYPSFVTLYKYDHLGSLIETTSADEGTSRFVYSLDGKIRFSQNQEQRNASPPRFSYTNYDYLGRPIESGEYTTKDASPYVFEPHTTTAPATYSVLKLVDDVGFIGVSRKLDAVRCTEYTFIEYDVKSTDVPAEHGNWQQVNTQGQITRTENENGKSWYSYDEFGQLEWMQQSITGLGTKMVHYSYDYLGNVTQVGYQMGKPDAFYHHYIYNKDQQVVEVLTSKDGTTKTSRAKYSYYLHGPLKRVTLGNNIQGIDYIYGINGELKSINNADKDKDPGLDGNDAFGMTLDYFPNDYQSANGNAGSFSISGLTDQYGGLPKAINYHNAVDANKKRFYAYTYDNRYQLQDAQWGSHVAINDGVYTGTILPSKPYRENIPAYDKNGNIQALLRTDGQGVTNDNFSYVYEVGSNKLDKITKNAVTEVDYSYNSIGQMIEQAEGSKTLKVIYNTYGLTKEVRNATNQLVLSYHYDDRGDLLKKTTYASGVAANNTFYVHDAAGNTLATYEQAMPSGTPVLSEVPVFGAGRIGIYKPIPNVCFYEVNDHLGNVRAVIGQPETDTFLATMESESAITEEPPFGNVNARRVVSIAANNTPSGNEAVRINNTRPAGPAISLPVTPGDKIDLEVWAYYEAGSGYNSSLGSSTLITAIAAAFGGVSGVAGEPGRIFNTINEGINAGTMGLGNTGSNTLPGAYMQYMVYDNNYNFKFGGYQRVTSSGNMAKERILQPTITIEEPGYIYVFLYNASNSANWVYFDDFKLTHTHSSIVAGSDYYAFGLAMEGREITEEFYRYGYQGQYAQKDTTTGFNEFQLRLYDPRFGRWLSPDPYGQFYSPYLGMDNSPHMGVDPDGGWNLGASMVGAAVGFGVGSVMGLLLDKENWLGYGLGGAAGGAIAGGLAGNIACNGCNFIDKTVSEMNVALTGKGGYLNRSIMGDGRVVNYGPGAFSNVYYTKILLFVPKFGLLKGEGAVSGLNPKDTHVIQGRTKLQSQVKVYDDKENLLLANDSYENPKAKSFTVKLPVRSTGASVVVGKGRYKERPVLFDEKGWPYLGNNEVYFDQPGYDYRPTKLALLNGKINRRIKIRVKSVHKTYTGGSLLKLR